MWKHFVALGDSLTEGIGDGIDRVNGFGWADLFYQNLSKENPGLRYTNLAQRGLITSTVSATQLAPALELQPDLVSVIAGANDILKSQWKPAVYEAEMEAMFKTLTATGATVLTATMPNFLFLDVPPRFKERITRHITEANEIIRDLAHRYNVRYGECWNEPATLSADFWSADGVHPNASGYANLAQVMLSALNTRSIRRGWSCEAKAS